MAGYQLPGPLCRFLAAFAIDTGTLCRGRSGTPGLVGSGSGSKTDANPSRGHSATPEELQRILSEAEKIAKKGLTHDQIPCNEFVNQAINAAFPGTVGRGINTTAMLHGKGPFVRVTTPAVGDLVVWPDPGHVAFVTSISNGAVGQFLGSQSSTGPHHVDLPNPYWSPRIALPGVLYLRVRLGN